MGRSPEEDRRRKRRKYHYKKGRKNVLNWSHLGMPKEGTPFMSEKGPIKDSGDRLEEIGL